MDNGDWTPIHLAVEHSDAETTARLLDAGADPNTVCCWNMTLLLHAIDAEVDGAVQTSQPLTVATTAVLLAYGADPRRPGPDGTLPLRFATQHGHDLAARLLSAHIDRLGDRT